MIICGHRKALFKSEDMVIPLRCPESNDPRDSLTARTRPYLSGAFAWKRPRMVQHSDRFALTNRPTLGPYSIKSINQGGDHPMPCSLTHR